MGLLVTWACVGLALALHSVRADGNVGCLFSPSLCAPDVEWCYNDEAFGRCLQQNVDEEDLYRHELSPDELQELEREMERLLNLGYRWSHSYTQCLLQAMLYAYKIRTVYEPEVCSNLKDQDLSSALKAFESDEMAIDPQNVAYVKFTPSANNPHADFADEVYFPPVPLDSDFVPVPEQLNLEREELDSEDDDVPVVMEDEPEYLNVGGGYSQRQFPFSLVRKKSSPQQLALHFSQNYNTPDDFRRGFETKDLTPETLQDDSLFSNIPQEFSSGEISQERIHRQLILPLQEETNEEEPSNSLLMPMLRAIGDTYPSPREREDEGRSRLLEELSHRMAEGEGEVARGYTEGGLVLIPDKQPDADQSLSEFLVGLNSDINWGFKRPERLDVKKPGPPFKTNNYAFKGQTEDQLISIKADEDHSEKASHKHRKSLVEHQTLHLESGTLPQQLELKSIRQELIEAAPHSSLDTYQLDTTDTNYVFIKFKDEVHTWRQGDHIIEAIARLLHVPKDLFGDIRVVRNEVTFRILSNNQDLNASTVANKIGDIKDDLKRQLGVTVTSVGVGNKKRTEEHLHPTISDEDQKEISSHKNSRNQVEDETDVNGAQSLQQPSLLSINDEVIEDAPQKKAYNPSEIDMAGSDQYDIVNTNFAFIKFKEIIHTWLQGEHIIETIAQLLHVPKETFDEIRVDRNEVTFRVLPNKQNFNASTVAKKIEDIKDVLKKKLRVTVTSAGIGDKTKLPAVLSLGADAEDEFLAVAFIVFVVLVTLVLCATLFILIRRYSASRAKIRSLTTPDTEASKDYQELCRARMAAKPPHDATAPTATSHRIASLSRESDNSPSSRSSTSSWSEEPALSSMDISTGHMVLSYMEDHLRNKDRLETEWAALCAYEAEPCATIIAQRPENAKKNRYVNALPYDHARVVLNELSNISGSDYINASTITDHDPRNPAYIATQGPLPHTAPDLWQMVWEQGCVVMVMLTRLIENDVSMCHRYWPEEGSELYHIYEVHLVSEHFWCDDYLVRSFYLKNLKTTETRTVTQFHFMSWPEGGVPVSTKALLEFRRKVNKSFRGRSCPIVVHCSDGVGRTGTYCLLDMVLNRMAKGAKEIDIAATLEHIRDQRGSSVATKQQFQFVLAAVAEEVQAILRILPQQKPEQPPVTQASAQ